MMLPGFRARRMKNIGRRLCLRRKSPSRKQSVFLRICARDVFRNTWQLRQCSRHSSVALKLSILTIKIISAINAVDTGSVGADGDDRRNRVAAKSQSGADLAAGALRCRRSRWRGRIFLSRAWRLAATWRQKTSSLQHHVWSAAFGAAALQCLRHARAAGQLVSERTMKSHRGGQPGYYPGFSTLDQQAQWDEATRKTVLERVSAG